ILLVGLVAIFAMILATSDVISQSNTSALVEHRQSIMKQMGRTFRIIVPIVKGENTNLNEAIAAAATVHTLANQISAVFPEGTGRDTFSNTRAKPEVWSKRQEFDQAAVKLVEESRKLIDAASTNQLEPFKAQFQTYVKACNGCHSGKGSRGGKFRFPKE
ncbi:MAG: c-type cytochrome, partial [Desulfobulbia bacterium]